MKKEEEKFNELKSWLVAKVLKLQRDVSECYEEREHYKVKIKKKYSYTKIRKTFTHSQNESKKYKQLF